MEFWLEAAGRAISTTGCHYRNGGYCCPHVILKGRGWISWEGGEAELAPGDVFSLFPDNVLDYWDDPDDPWVFLWCNLNGPTAANALQSSGLTARQPWFRPETPEPIQAAFEAAFDLLAPPVTAGPYRVAAATCTLFDALGCGRREAPEELSALAETIIRHQLHTGINVNELTAALGVERTTVFHAFRRRFGESPIQFIRRLRVERAQLLLSTTNDRLSAIARACGFRSETYFIRTFKAMTGVTALEYRKSHARKSV
jgi:AraC-like DNA-binding protein